MLTRRIVWNQCIHLISSINTAQLSPQAFVMQCTILQKSEQFYIELIKNHVQEIYIYNDLYK